MRNLTIRQKITIWFIVILMLIVGLSYGAFFAVTESVDRSEAQEDLLDIVNWDLDAISYEPGAAPENMDPADGSRWFPYGDGSLVIGEEFMDLFSGACVAVFDPEGTLIVGQNPIPAESKSLAYADDRMQTVKSGRDTFYVYDRLLRLDGAGDLWIRGAVDREQQQSEITRTLQISLIILPLLIILAAVVSYLIIRHSLQPVNRMIEAARSVSSGSDLKRRIDTGEGKKDEVQQLASSFNEMMQRLEGSFEAEKQFTSDASHELRTPMSVILAQCELALEEEELTPEEAREALLRIQRQGKRMDRLIDDMLTCTRIDRKHEKYPFTQVRLSELVKNVCGEFAEMEETWADGKNIRIESHIQEGIDVTGSAPLLERMLTNLISNGIRYGREGGFVRITLEEEGGTISLAVEDDGIGISPEHLPALFDRFYQVSGDRGGEGTGLGLAMVREIARLHGGDVTVKSSPEEGSVFTVIWPQRP